MEEILTPAAENSESFEIVIQKIPTIIFILMIVMAIALLYLVGHMCPQQEFLITCLFAVGFGGLYGLYVPKFQVEWLTKYKFHGSATIAALILFLAPTSYPETENPPHCVGIINGLLGASALHNSNVMTSGNEQFFTLIANASLQSPLKIKIVYPIGSKKLKTIAEELQTRFNQITLGRAIEASVWSIGNWKNSLTNQFKRIPDQIVIKYRDSVRSYVPAIKKGLTSFSEFTVVESDWSDREEVYDIVIEIGY